MKTGMKTGTNKLRLDLRKFIEQAEADFEESVMSQTRMNQFQPIFSHLAQAENSLRQAYAYAARLEASDEDA